jgi:phytanoyl-CoA hydroxylase
MLDLCEFRTKGAIVVRKVFRTDEVDAVRNDAKAVFVRQMIKRGYMSAIPSSEQNFDLSLYKYFQHHTDEFVNCGKQIQHLISLHRLSLDPRVIGIVQELGVATPNISTRPVLFFNSRYLAKEEVYWRVFPHQDWRSMQGSLDSLVVWIPLVDIGVALGALEVVPESHKKGLVTSSVENSFGKVDCFDNSAFESIEVSRGDALFFSTFLVHRSGNNVTESIRWSCHFRYNNLDEATFVERGYPHPYVYKPQDQLITPNFPSASQVSALFT